MRNVHRWGPLASIILIVFMLSACHKKPAQPTKALQPSESQSGQAEHPQPVPIVDESGTPVFSFASQLGPIFFDFDRFNIRKDQIETLLENTQILEEHPEVKIIIEGHCDERGTEEYNLALGERRAKGAKDYLVRLGVDENRLRIVSYGKSRPFAQGHNEDAWSQNRRAHFADAR